MTFSPEAQFAWTSGAFLVVNVVGWVFTANQTRKRAEKAAEKVRDQAAKELVQVTGQVDRVTETVGNLACVKNNDYLVNSGRLIEKVEGIDKKQDKLENKVDSILTHLKNGSNK